MAPATEYRCSETSGLPADRSAFDFAAETLDRLGVGGPDSAKRTMLVWRPEISGNNTVVAVAQLDPLEIVEDIAALCVVVHPAHRRAGLGTQACLAAADLARQRGITRLLTAISAATEQAQYLLGDPFLGIELVNAERIVFDLYLGTGPGDYATDRLPRAFSRLLTQYALDALQPVRLFE